MRREERAAKPAAAKMEGFFKMSESAQPPPVGGGYWRGLTRKGDVFVMAAGVTLRDGAQTKQGPPRATDGAKISRKEYLVRGFWVVR